MIHKTIVLLTLIVSLASCCKMSNQLEEVWITSNPPQAEIVIDGYHCGNSPLLVELDKKYDHSVYLFKEGYETVEGSIYSRRTIGSSRNVVWPFAGAAIGTGIGIACCGTGGCIIPAFVVGTALGTVAGLAMGVTGTAVDLGTRSDCTLSGHHFHGELPLQQ